MSGAQTSVRVKATKRIALTLLSLVLIGAALLLSLRYCYGPIEAYPLRYEQIVTRYAEQYGVPRNLVLAVIRTESDFDVEATSSVGARGLMQLMPATYRWLSDEMLFDHLPDEQITDPEVNIRYGVYYLRQLYDRYGSWLTACAAYNAGPGTVDDWLKSGPLMASSDGTLRPLFIPITETRNYVLKIEKSLGAYDYYYPDGAATDFR